jgi:hypothetical protein
MAALRTSMLARTMLRIVAVAVALVVGRAPALSPVRHAAVPVLCSADQPAKADALRAGERVEPRVAPAPEIDRAVRLPALLAQREACAVRLRAATAAPLPVGLARDQRVSVLQRIPRLEPGEPPRVA